MATHVLVGRVVPFVKYPMTLLWERKDQQGERATERPQHAMRMKGRKESQMLGVDLMDISTEITGGQHHRGREN